VISGNGARSERFLQPIGGVGQQPAITHAKREEGAQALVSTASGAGVAIPTTAELLELRRPDCVEAYELMRFTPGKKASLEQSPHGRKCRRRKFAGDLIGEIGANGLLDFDHAGEFRTTLEFTCEPFGLRPVASLGTLADQALPFQAAANPFWATAAAVVNVSLRTRRVVAGGGVGGGERLLESPWAGGGGGAGR